MDKKFLPISTIASKLSNSSYYIRLPFHYIVWNKFGIFKFPHIDLGERNKMSVPEDQQSVNRVAARLPPFWEENPDIWFAQVEAQFIVAGITVDDTKFNHVIGNIDGKILSRVSNIVISPPVANKYEALKAAILIAFADSQQKKSSKLLAEIELGDRKPSELLNHMRKLADNKVTDDFLRTLWSRCLPANVSAILSTSEADLSGLAKMADKIMEVADFSTHISAVSSIQTASQPLDQKITQLEKALVDLNSQMKNISMSLNKIRSRSRSRSRSHAASSTSSTDADLCWYHKKFADKAHKCIEPCSFKSETKND